MSARLWISVPRHEPLLETASSKEKRLKKYHISPFKQIFSTLNIDYVFMAKSLPVIMNITTRLIAQVFWNLYDINMSKRYSELNSVTLKYNK